MAQHIKNLPTVQKTQEIWVLSLGWKDPLEKEMATHSSISCLKNPMVGYSPWGQKESYMTVTKGSQKRHLVLNSINSRD